MKITKYPDNTSYVTVKDTPNKFTYRLNSYEDLWHLNQTVDAIRDLTDEPLHITIPNLIDAQADRRFNEGESSGLKLVCNFLNSMKGVAWAVFHPHNPEVVEALIDDVYIVDNKDFIERVLKKEFESPFNNKLLLDNLTLMSSDAGGFKPLTKLCKKIDWKGEIYSASKGREWSEKEGSKLTQIVDREDFNKKDILIVDDISVYGGTFKGLSKILKQRNCGKLYLAVSHMTVQDLGSDHICNYFDKVFTTNSKFNNYYARGKARGYQPDNLEIIKLF